MEKHDIDESVATHVESKRFDAQMDSKEITESLYADYYALLIRKMSHEIRLMLNDIVTAQMVIRLRPDEQDRVSDCLNLVDTRCDDVKKLLHRVWYISQLAAGKMPWEEEPVDLQEVITDIVNSIKENLGEQKRNIQMEIDHITHSTVISDYRRIYHLFENLLDNCVKFTHEGGEIKIAAREVSCLGKTARYEFTITDNGIGIEAEFMEHLYTPFYRSERAEGKKMTGKGLGLAIVHNILKILKGEIAVESEPDKGTVFTVTLGLPVYEQNKGVNEA